MSDDPYCIGYRRNPHVPDSGLIVTNLGGRSGVRLCRDCWHVWNGEDYGEVDE